MLLKAPYTICIIHAPTNQHVNRVGTAAPWTAPAISCGTRGACPRCGGCVRRPLLLAGWIMTRNLLR